MGPAFGLAVGSAEAYTAARDEARGNGGVEQARQPRSAHEACVAIRHTAWHPVPMPYYQWNADKNEQLKTERGISFEQVVMHIEGGDLLDVYEHANQARYPGQQILIVRVGEYAWVVPFVETADGRFLKTIIPSRKATREYLGDSDEKG